MTNQLDHSGFQKQLQSLAEETYVLSDQLVIAKKYNWEICHLSKGMIQTWVVEGKALAKKYAQTLAEVILTSTDKQEEGSPSHLIAHLNSEQGSIPLYVNSLSQKQFKTLNQTLRTVTHQSLMSSTELQSLLSTGKVTEIETLLKRSTAQKALIYDTFQQMSLDSWDILKLFFLCIDQKCFQFAEYLLTNYHGPQEKELVKFYREALLSNSYLSYDYPESTCNAMSYAVKLFGDQLPFMRSLIQAGMNPHHPDVYREIGNLQNTSLIDYWLNLCSDKEKKSFACEVFNSFIHFYPHGEMEEVERKITQFTLALDSLMPHLDLYSQNSSGRNLLQQILRGISPYSIKRILIDRILKVDPTKNAYLINYQDYYEETVLFSIQKNTLSPQEATELVNLFIQHGADINLPNRQGLSPLHHALRERSHSVAQLLIEKGADLGQRNKEGHTPLQAALNYLGSVAPLPQELLDLLVLKTPDSSAQIEQYIANCTTCNPFNIDEWLFVKRHVKLETLSDLEFLNYLHWAYRFKDFTFLRNNLFKRPGMLEMRDANHHTLLFNIFEELSKHKEIGPETLSLIQELLARGGQQGQKECAFYLAEKGADHLLEILLPRVGLITPDQRGKTPFHYLVSHKKSLAPFAAYLSDTYEGSSLQLALESRDLKRIETLCEAGEHLKCIDRKGRCALHHACIKGDVEVFKVLYPFYQKSYLPTDYENQTPLHHAVLCNQVEMIRQFNPQEMTKYDAQTIVIDVFKTALTHHKWREADALLSAGFSTEKKDSHVILSFLSSQPLPNYFAQKGDLAALQWLKEKKLLSLANRDRILVDAVVSKKAEIVDFLLSEGFPAIGYYNPLEVALRYQDIPILKLLLEKGNLFQFTRDLIMDKPVLKEIGTTDNPEILQLFYEHLPKYNQERLTLAILEKAKRCKELKLIRFLIQEHQSFNPSEVEEIIQTVHKQLGSFETLNPQVFIHLLKNGKTLDEWRETLALSGDISRTLDGLNIEDEDEKKCLAYENIVKEIFDFIYGRLSSETAKSTGFLQKLSGVVKLITDKNQIGLLFNGLKTHCTIEAIEEAIDISLLYFQTGVPSTAEFEQMPPSLQRKWLQYISSMRLRDGLDLCLWTLNNVSEQASLLSALTAVEKIATPLTNSERKTLLSLYALSTDPQIRKGCVKALWETQPNPWDHLTRNEFFALLKTSSDPSIQCTLIEVLCHYQYNRNETNDREMLDALIALSHSADLNIRIQSALSLSQVLDEPCLLRAAEIVQSADWERYDSEFRQDEVGLFAGDPFAFIKKPEFQDSRSSLLKLIQDQLAELHWTALSPQIQAQYDSFIQTPQRYPQLQELLKNMKSLPDVARYLHLPMYFPTGPTRFIFRGLKARKGEKVLFEGIRDLIRKGCGSSDLSYFGARFDFGTWSKVGHMFGSHDIKTAKAYSDDANGIIVCFDPDYYNSEYRKRHARLEIEGTINTVNYRGIPKHAIRRIYIPETYRKDFELLYNDKKPIEKVKEKLTTEVFKNVSIEQLSKLRRDLKEPVLLLSQGKPIIHEGKHLTKSYFDTLRFYTPYEQEKIFSESDIQPITVDDVHEETIKRAIGRQLVREKYSAEFPARFMAQDEMLHQLSDMQFKEVASTVFEDLIKERKEFRLISKGKIAPKSLDQHTLELFTGSPEHLGLFTELNVTSLSQERCRAALRLACLYYFSGKLKSTPHQMLSETVAFARVHLKRNAPLLSLAKQDDALILSLLMHHRLFKDYFQKKIGLDELKQVVAFEAKKLPSPISPDDYFKMLASLYIATIDLKKFPHLNPEHTLQQICDQGMSVQPEGIAEEHAPLIKLGLLSDKAFREEVEELITALPYSFGDFAQHPAGHGRKADKTFVNLLEHTLEVIRGKFGGFGLKTDLTIQGLIKSQIRKVLRLAALFHDSGKIKGLGPQHIEHSLFIAHQALQDAAWGLTKEELQLIETLIECNDFYGQYFMGKINEKELEQKLHKCHSHLFIKLSDNDFRKLAFALWIADSSTLVVVNRTNKAIYRPLFEKLDLLDFTKLEGIIEAKRALMRIPLTQAASQHPSKLFMHIQSTAC